MNWYEIFYWLTVADNARVLFYWGAAIFSIGAVVSVITYFTAFNENGDPDPHQPMSRKWIWWSTPFAMFFWMLIVFTPNKRDALFILAGGGAIEFLTQDTSAQKIPTELTTFVVNQLRSMSEDVQIEIGLAKTKHQIISEAKNMTTEELLKRMSVDSTFANIILGKQ